MNIAVHIGFSKAASTFLQSTIFSGAHTEIGLLDKNEQQLSKGAWKPQKTGAFIDRYIGADGKSSRQTQAVFPFGFQAEREHKKIMSRVKHYRNLTVISNEDYAGHPFSGGALGELFGKRIHQSLPKAKIIIVIREQRKMVLSHYAHLVTRSHTRMGLEQFLAPKLWLQSPGFHHSVFEYSRIISWYQQLFGSDQVLIVPFELVNVDQTRFFQMITNFLGVNSFEPKPVKTKNQRDYAEYCTLRRMPWINKFGRCVPTNGYTGLDKQKLRNRLLTVMGSTVSKKSLSKRVEQDLSLIESKILADVSRDNVRLAKLVDFDLESLGYSLP